MRETEVATGKAWEQKVASYTMLLSDLDEERLERALVAVGREPGRIFFPTTGEIRAVTEKERQEGIGGAADCAWAKLQAYMGEWGCPPAPRTEIKAGTQVEKKPPRLDRPTGYALSVCGGYDAVFYTNVEHSHFVRQRFTEAYVRMLEQETRNLLPARDASTIYREIRLLAGLPKEITGETNGKA